MEIIRSAFERSPGDSQQIGSERIPPLNTLVGVFVSLRARLIIPYFILTLLSAIVDVYLTARLVNSRLRERLIAQQTEAGWVAGYPPWHQNIRASEIAHKRGRANAALFRASSTPSDTSLLNSASCQLYFKINTNHSWPAAVGNSIMPNREA